MAATIFLGAYYVNETEAQVDKETSGAASSTPLKSPLRPIDSRGFLRHSLVAGRLSPNTPLRLLVIADRLSKEGERKETIRVEQRMEGRWEALRRFGGREAVELGNGSVGFYSHDVSIECSVNVVSDTEVQVDVNLEMSEVKPHSENIVRTRKRKAEEKKTIWIGKTFSLYLDDPAPGVENVELKITTERIKRE